MAAAGTIKLIPSGELGSGEVREMTVGGDDVLVYRSVDGGCRVVAAHCPHMGNYMPNGLPPGEPLSRLLRGGGLRCPYHGWCFDGAGRCTDIPAGQRVPAKVHRAEPVLKRWVAVEREGWIEVENR